MTAIDLHQKIDQIKTEIIAPQQLGNLIYRLSSTHKFVIWYNAHYQTNWFCLNCEKDDETEIALDIEPGHFETYIIHCLRCNTRDPQSNLDASSTRIREAWESAKAIVSHSFDPEIIRATEKSSLERLQRLESGESTWEDEEAVLLMQWRALKNIEKNQD